MKKQIALITRKQLKDKLQWKRIFEERDETGLEQGDGNIYYFRRFIVRPKRDNLPYISFVFDDAVSVLEGFGFGAWHQDTNSFRASITLARRLLSHHFCISEHLNASGECRTVGLYRPNEIPKTLRKEVKQFRKWFFGEDPILEPVNYSRYVEGKGILIERRYRAKVERAKSKVKSVKPLIKNPFIRSWFT